MSSPNTLRNEVDDILRCFAHQDGFFLAYVNSQLSDKKLIEFSKTKDINEKYNKAKEILFPENVAIQELHDNVLAITKDVNVNLPNCIKVKYAGEYCQDIHTEICKFFNTKSYNFTLKDCKSICKILDALLYTHGKTLFIAYTMIYEYIKKCEIPKEDDDVVKALLQLNPPRKPKKRPGFVYVAEDELKPLYPSKKKPNGQIMFYGEELLLLNRKKSP